METEITFEDKVKDALRDVMLHAIAGHDSDSGFTHVFCSDPNHALEVLKDRGIVLMNQHTIDKILDTQP